MVGQYINYEKPNDLLTRFKLNWLYIPAYASDLGVWGWGGSASPPAFYTLYAKLDLFILIILSFFW